MRNVRRPTAEQIGRKMAAVTRGPADSPASWSVLPRRDALAVDGDLILLGDNLRSGGASRTARSGWSTSTRRSTRAGRSPADRCASRADAGGDRTGFGGRRYRTELLGDSSYDDTFDDYLGFLEPRLRETHRLLDADGTLYLHLDYREAHYVKLLLDEIFGRDAS